MRFIPLEYLTIVTFLAPAEVRARLSEALEPGARHPAVRLAGSVGLATCVVRRVGVTRRTLAPEFRGRIEPWEEATRLTGMVSVSVPPVLLLAVAAVASFAFGIEPLIDVLAGEPAALLRLAPLVTVIVAWVLMVRGVEAEARRLRRLLHGVLGPPARGGRPPSFRAT